MDVNLLSTTLQVESGTAAASELMEYGLLGILLVLLGLYAWSQQKRERQHADDYKKNYEASHEKYIDLTTRTTITQERQTEILTKMYKDIEEMPAAIVREMKIDGTCKASINTNQNSNQNHNHL